MSLGTGDTDDQTGTGPWGAPPSPAHCPTCGEHHCVRRVAGSPGPRGGPALSIRTPVPCEAMSRGDCPPDHPSLLQGPESWGCSGRHSDSVGRRQWAGWPNTRCEARCIWVPARCPWPAVRLCAGDLIPPGPSFSVRAGAERELGSCTQRRVVDAPSAGAVLATRQPPAPLRSGGAAREAPVFRERLGLFHEKVALGAAGAHAMSAPAGEDRFGRRVITFSCCRMPPSHELSHRRLLE